jgi:Cu2+-containing amine oxidase
MVCYACLATFAHSGDAVNPRELTAAEHEKVSALAEKALKDRDLWKGKIVLTNSEVVLDSATTPPERIAILTYYRYDGDLGIVLHVDLKKQSVTDVHKHPHMPTSLTAQEIAEADKIARGNAEVQKALARYKHLDRIEVDTIVAQIISPEVPGYHHRVARLFFRDAKRNYLQLVPMVDVDLTTGEVRLDVIAGLHDTKK